MMLRVPQLESGDKLDQSTFHARYEAMPAGTRAELIGGIVYMASPTKNPHGRTQNLVSWWLEEYVAATPGVHAGAGATTILSDVSEPQPDGCLYVQAERGGQSRVNEEGYIEGAPELVIEIASSTEAIDLHAKKDDYEKSGVREYVVVALRQQQVFWHVWHEGKFLERKPAGTDDILRSTVFPGLWLDPHALLRLDHERLREVLNQGLADPAHAEFVNQLTGRGSRTHAP